jgi:hypothetical protein
MHNGEDVVDNFFVCGCSTIVIEHGEFNSESVKDFFHKWEGNPAHAVPVGKNNFSDFSFVCSVQKGR